MTAAPGGGRSSGGGPCGGSRGGGSRGGDSRREGSRDVACGGSATKGDADGAAATAGHRRLAILALPGSLRRASFNLALLRAAAELVPADCDVHVASLHGIPLYDGDVEASAGIPAVVTALQDRLAASDALLIATPEYNNSIPGPLKNAIDWLSRPSKEIPRVFGGLPTGLIGATPGRGGTRLAQSAWLPVLRTLGMHAFFGKTLYVDSVAGQFDAEGAMIDEAARERLRAYVDAFVAFVRETSRQRLAR